MGHHLQASFELPSPVNKAKAPSLQNTAVGSPAEESLLLEVFTAIEFFPSLRGVQRMDTKPRKCKHTGHLTGHKPRSFKKNKCTTFTALWKHIIVKDSSFTTSELTSTVLVEVR